MNNALQKTNPIEGFLPSWATLVDINSFYITTIKPNDTFVERAAFNVRGCVVEILRYDRSDEGVVVYIGGHPKIMKMSEIGEYVRNNT